jgi:hypothetical protein
MIGRLINNKLGRTWKEAVKASIFLEELIKTKKNLSWSPIFEPRFEARVSGTCSRIVNHWAGTFGV